MVFQSNWSCPNQSQPKRLGPDPSMTVKVRSAVCEPYFTTTFILPATGIASPVNVVNNSEDVDRIASGNSFFQVSSEMIDTVAPVSIFMVNFFLLISSSTVMGCEDLDPIRYIGTSESESKFGNSVCTHLASLCCCLSAVFLLTVFFFSTACGSF